jgi:hypothetical protein
VRNLADTRSLSSANKKMQNPDNSIVKLEMEEFKTNISLTGSDKVEGVATCLLEILSIFAKPSVGGITAPCKLEIVLCSMAY